MSTEAPLILLVDDDDIFTATLARALSRRGFQVQCAQTIGQAMDLANKHCPDYAIVDMKLESESGLQLIPVLKAEHPTTKLLILTGYSSISTAVEAIKLGATNYLCKPAGVDEILSAFETTEGVETAALPDTPPSVNRLEWEHIQKVLAENDGNVSATARSLGMHRRTLQRKLQKRPTHR